MAPMDGIVYASDQPILTSNGYVQTLVEKIVSD